MLMPVDGLKRFLLARDPDAGNKFLATDLDFRGVWDLYNDTS